MLILVSCEPPSIPEEDTKLEHSTEESLHNVAVGDVEIILIDSCEYIIYKETEGANHGFGYMAHKGNCNNPAHIYRQNSVNDSVQLIDSTLTSPN